MATTTIKQRQIEDGAINNAKVAAGAGIVTTKLADGASFILKEGTVAMTGNLNMGSQLITNLQTPSGAGDAANKSYVDGLIAGLNAIFDSKPSARAATTGNINLANPGTAIFDGVTLATNELLWVRAQTAPAENGLYKFNGSGSALTRIPEMNAWVEFPGAWFAVEEGSTYADTIWLITVNQGGTLETTAVTFVQLPTTAGGLTASNFVTREVPAGAINGSNTTFTLANTPTAATEEAFLNGLLQNVGAGNDYTISGAVITMLAAPLTGDVILVNYRK